MLGYLVVEVFSDWVLRLSRNEKVGGNHSSSCGGKKNKTTGGAQWWRSVASGGAQWRRSVASGGATAGLFDGRELNVDLNCIDLFFLF